jgi:hypothetical protein
MTRALSELLGAREPAFRMGLRQLEQASGCPSEDIRLSSEVRQKAQQALVELNLDPRDTTGPELYNVLLERLKHDDEAVRDLLGTDPKSSNQNLMLRTQRLLKSLDIPRSAFALKIVVAKRLLKKNPPKKAMKRLGYRSLDSMLKHEPVPQIYAAAAIAETAQWHKALLTGYKQLLPTDFEVRSVAALAPNSKRWETLGGDYVKHARHNILTFKELGAVILLPLAADTVPGVALMTLLLALNAINDIRETSAYFKLHQVRPDFGSVVAGAARSEPYAAATLVNEERLPWKLVQRFFANTPGAFVPELFEPHVQQDDLKTVPVEKVLAKLHPRFEFWNGKAHTGLLHDGKPVSLNLTDAALNFCNHLPYERRVVHYFRDHLWHELMLRYMHQNNLEQTLNEQLGRELVDEKALA